MKRTLCNVAYLDGRVESYPVTPKVEVTFEKIYKKSLSPRTFEGDGGTWLTYCLAWEAMRAHKARTAPQEVIPAVDAWVELLEAVDVDKEDIVPLALAASDAPSPSPSTSMSTPSDS